MSMAAAALERAARCGAGSGRDRECCCCRQARRALAAMRGWAAAARRASRIEHAGPAGAAPAAAARPGPWPCAGARAARTRGWTCACAAPPPHQAVQRPQPPALTRASVADRGSDGGRAPIQRAACECSPASAHGCRRGASAAGSERRQPARASTSRPSWCAVRQARQPGVSYDAGCMPHATSSQPPPPQPLAPLPCRQHGAGRSQALSRGMAAARLRSRRCSSVRRSPPSGPSPSDCVRASPAPLSSSAAACAAAAAAPAAAAAASTAPWDQHTRRNQPSARIVLGAGGRCAGAACARPPQPGAAATERPGGFCLGERRPAPSHAALAGRAAGQAAGATARCARRGPRGARPHLLLWQRGERHADDRAQARVARGRRAALRRLHRAAGRRQRVQRRGRAAARRRARLRLRARRCRPGQRGRGRGGGGGAVRQRRRAAQPHGQAAARRRQAVARAGDVAPQRRARRVRAGRRRAAGAGGVRPGAGARLAAAVGGRRQRALSRAQQRRGRLALCGARHRHARAGASAGFGALARRDGRRLARERRRARRRGCAGGVGGRRRRRWRRRRRARRRARAAAAPAARRGRRRWRLREQRAERRVRRAARRHRRRRVGERVRALRRCGLHRGSGCSCRRLSSDRNDSEQLP